MAIRTLLRLAAAVSLLALAGCQGWNHPVSDEQRLGALMVLQSGSTLPRPYYHQPYMMPIPQTRGFSCSNYDGFNTNCY